MNNTKQRRINLYASRSIGETLSATFDFVTQNFVPLIKFLSAFLLPVSACLLYTSPSPRDIGEDLV